MPIKERTATEMAFAKAQAFDAIYGYLIESSGCEIPDYCSENLAKRYSMRDMFPETSQVLGTLEKYFKSKKEDNNWQTGRTL